jgi:prevent-host-death family protein
VCWLSWPLHKGYNGHMDKATISQLKNRLSAYIRKARAGHTILIFDRDEPVARLEGIRQDDRAGDRVTRLERAGLARRPSAPVPIKALRATAARPKRSVVQALIDERRESR